MNAQSNGEGHQDGAKPSEHPEASSLGARSSQVGEGEAFEFPGESPPPAKDAGAHSIESVHEVVHESRPEPEPAPPVETEAVAPTERSAPAPEGEPLPPRHAATPEAGTPEQESNSDEPPQPARKRSGLLPIAALVGVALIGGGIYLSWEQAGTYLSWDQFEALRDKALGMINAPPVDSDAGKRDAEDIGAAKSDVAKSDAAEAGAAKSDAAEPTADKSAAAEPSAAKPDAAESDAAKPDAAEPTAAKSEAAAPPSSEQAAQSAAPAAKDAATPEAAINPDAGKGEPAAASTSTAAVAPPDEMAPPVPPDQAKADAGPGPDERALGAKLESTQAQLTEARMQQAETQAQLSLTQAQLSQMQLRIAATEATLAAAKTETRALSAPDSTPPHADDASARLVLAQSALTALRQDVDASGLLGALETQGADPIHVAQIRAGLSAPSLARLKADFAALSDRIVAVSAPPPAPKPAEGAGAPRGFGEKALSFMQIRAEKILKVRKPGSAETQAASHVAKALKDLNAGDLAGALAEQALLPDAAREVAADWAKAAKARLDAESAAKAEVDAALQNLSKAKN